MFNVLALQMLGDANDAECFFDSTQSICCNGSFQSVTNCCNRPPSLEA